jgi:predicted Zn-dependent protease with MMP-like domain
MAHAALRAIPPRFRAHLDDVVVRVAEFATAEQLAAVGLDDKWELSGLYEGRPLSERSIWDAGEMPAMVTLFRQPLLQEWRTTGVGLDELVAHVVIHEIGHHFGFSDETMHRLEDGEDF